MSPGKVGNSRGRLTPLQDDILLCLKEEPKSLAGLRTRIDARDTSVLHAMKELESEKLVHKDTVTHSYSLTSIGVMYAIMLGQLLRATNALGQMEDFWLNHDISGIPEHLLTGIWALDKASVVRAIPSDLDAIHSKFLDQLKGSTKADGVSPVFHPDFVAAMAEIAGKGAEVRVIITKEVLDKVRKEVQLKDLARYVKRILINRNLQVYTHEALKVGLTVTDKFLSLGLFTPDGAYDYSVDVMSSDPRALEWGERLFDYYRENSERIKLTSVL
jgi:predicted transcriptional regulator